MSKETAKKASASKWRGGKQKYSLFSNLRYIGTAVNKIDRSFLPFLFLLTGTSAVIEPMWSFFNRDMVNFVLSEGERERLFFRMVLMILCIVCVMIFNSLANNKIWRKQYRKIVYNFHMMLVRKTFDTDYENLERPETKDKYEKANMGSGNFDLLYQRAADLIGRIFTMLSWGAILCTLSPWLILIIFVPTFFYYEAIKYKIKWFNRNQEKWIPMERKINYVRRASRNFANAKDVRLYNMESWFLKKMKDFAEERLWWYKKQGTLEFKNGFVMLAVVAVRDILSYGFIVFNVVGGKLTAGDFMLYFSSVSAIANSFYRFLDDMANMEWLNVIFSQFREFMDIPDKSNRGKGKPLPEDKFDIRFENVSYSFGGSDEPTLKNLNFTIKTGEKIAVVGNNGAGKTTLVKLICGIYRPTEGEIYVNGTPIREYNRDEYYTLIAAVFQDIRFMPSTIAENIAMSDRYEREDIDFVLSRSGLKEKTDLLPDGADTYLLRSVHDSAIDLSGGEAQKLALARALYKQRRFGSKILLLDEPTSALDPIAEQNMYLEYSKFTENKTSVFISHRLASTQFCDRIFYLKNGEITETGSHRELLEKGGEYAEMFNLQSQYYRDEEIKEKRKEAYADEI